ncbi:interleukin-17 receptor D, partial [Elysia marginata]
VALKQVERGKMAVLIFFVSSLFASLLTRSALSQPVPCTLKVFEGDSKDEIEGVCIQEFQTEDCKPFVESFNRSALPEGFALTHDDDSVQKPESIELTSRMTPYRYKDNIRYLIPGVNIVWTSPIANLNPWKWTPSLSLKVLNNGTLQVKISHSPRVFNLTQFQVQLVKYSYDQRNAFRAVYYTQPPGSNSPEGIVTFSNLETDQYRVVVHVLDPFPQIENKCLCWETEANNKRRCRLNCGSVGTRYVNVTGVALETITTPRTADTATTTKDLEPAPAPVKIRPEEGSASETSLIIGVTCAAVAFFGVMVAVFVVFRRKHSQKKNSGPILDSQQKPPSGPIVQGLKAKSVFIVSTEDNPAHTHMVEELAKFLKDCCMCHVFFPPWENMGSHYQDWFVWSRKTQDLANYILLVDSEGAENLMAVHKRTRGLNGPVTGGNRADVIFNLVVENFYLLPDAPKKTIILHYREKCGCSDHFSVPPKIRLPDAIPDLLRSIHNLNKEETEANMQCLPLSSNCYDKTKDEGHISKNLMSALEMLQQPSYTRMVSKVSADTGIGSDADATSNCSSMGPDEGSLIGFNAGEDVTEPPSSPVPDGDGSTIYTVASNYFNGGSERVPLEDIIETMAEPQSIVNPQHIVPLTLCADRLDEAIYSDGGNKVETGAELQDFFPPQSCLPQDPKSTFQDALWDINSITESSYNV